MTQMGSTAPLATRGLNELIRYLFLFFSSYFGALIQTEQKKAKIKMEERKKKQRHI